MSATFTQRSGSMSFFGERGSSGYGATLNTSGQLYGVVHVLSVVQEINLD
jgi:hypothetical protein